MTRTDASRPMPSLGPEPDPTLGPWSTVARVGALVHLGLSGLLAAYCVFLAISSVADPARDPDGFGVFIGGIFALVLLMAVLWFAMAGMAITRGSQAGLWTYTLGAVLVSSMIGLYFGTPPVIGVALALAFAHVFVAVRAQREIAAAAA